MSFRPDLAIVTRYIGHGRPDENVALNVPLINDLSHWRAYNVSLHFVEALGARIYHHWTYRARLPRLFQVVQEDQSVRRFPKSSVIL